MSYRLIYSEFDKPILLEEDKFTVLKIEDKETYYKFLKDLYSQYNRGGECFNLSKNNKSLKLEKESLWINNLFDLEVNSRTRLRKLYTELEQNINRTELNEKVLNLWLKIEEMINTYIVLEGNLESKDEFIGIASILELMGVQFYDDFDERLIDRLENFMILNRDYSSINLFVLNNASSVLSIEELQELQTFSKREDICILYLDTEFDFHTLSNGYRGLIVDEDLCYIEITEP